MPSAPKPSRRARIRPPPSGKTTAPALENVVPRTRLFRRLDRARGPLLWLAGPPGSGKTVLAASYLRARRLPFVWYQLDADDADVATFVYHLGAAVRRQARRGRRRPLPLLKQEFQLGLASFARRFFRDVYSRLQPRFVVVLDDYQEVSEHAVLHDVVRLAAAELPTGSRLLILSRAHPPAALAHLRATEKIELVQWPALQLSLAEATAIARRRRSARLSA